VAVNQKGDKFLSCNSIRKEIHQNKILITKKVNHDKSKFLSNTFWFIMWPPAMDFKEAEKSEAEALQRRNNRLESLLLDKGCE